MDFEIVILNSLLYNKEYVKKVLPFLKHKYFDSIENKKIFSCIVSYILKYKKIPSKEIIFLELKEKETSFEKIENVLNLLNGNENKYEIEWLVDYTEKWVKNRSIYLALMDSIQILDKSTKSNEIVNPELNQIESLFKDALSISFNTDIGHNYVQDYKKRYDFYTRREEKIPFDIDILNQITKGGLNKKTLNVIMAPTGVGKTIFLSHWAAACLSMGYNILYITMEMAEERIAERIDANLLNIPVDMISSLPPDIYYKKFEKMISTLKVGKLFIKEYPSSSANVLDFSNLLNELKYKQNFIPQAIAIDYLNICGSSRVKNFYGDLYSYNKFIAEELRGFATENNIPIFTATQTNKDGYENSNPSLKNTSESYGINSTADLFLALISNVELENNNQIFFKQLKNRYADKNKPESFAVGLDKSRMKFFNTKEIDIFDVNNEESNEGEKFKSSKAKNYFSGIKF